MDGLTKPGKEATDSVWTLAEEDFRTEPALVVVSLIAVLAIWFVLSIINQFGERALPATLRRADGGGLLPNWTFFAPNPGVVDLEIVFADQSADGGWSPWRTLAFRRSRMPRLIWNPGKRFEKAVSDLSQSLLGSYHNETNRTNTSVLGLAYIWLLWVVEGQPRDSWATKRRFAIISATRDLDEDPPEPLYISEPVDLHHLDA